MATQEKKGISTELLDGLLAGDAAEVFRSGAGRCMFKSCRASTLLPHDRVSNT